MDKKAPSDPNNRKLKSNNKLTFLLIGGVFFMFGFSYLMVPIFTFVCKQAGINGKNVLAPAATNSRLQMDASRTIKIEFTTAIHGKLGFLFSPEKRYIYLHPGERTTVYFYAENKTGQAATIQAVPSITPADGARFFKKIECFCFTQQNFSKNEKAKMFVNFYIDPALPRQVKEITLAYTVFDAAGHKAKTTLEAKGRIKI